MAQNLGDITNNSFLAIGKPNPNDQSLNMLETSQNFGGQNDITDNSNLYMNSFHEESPEKDTDDKFREIQVLQNDQSLTYETSPKMGDQQK